MKSGTNARLILFHHQNLHKTPPAIAAGRLCLLFFTFSTLAFFTFTLVNTAIPSLSSPSPVPVPVPPSVQDALLHYASPANATNTGRMSAAELATVSSAIRQCRSGCNVLVFGLTHESLLYRALNTNGRTVFLDENEFLITRMEHQHRGIEAYDVQYTTKVSELQELIQSAKDNVRGDCGPVQNLLFSDCRLAMNDLPNHIYEIDWDVIVIDGPAGYSPTSPGRMSAIFTAAVLARSKKASGGGTISKTHVLVHDVDREAEKMCSEEYLCKENMAEIVDRLGHFVIGKMDSVSSNVGFCSNSSSVTSLPSL